MTLKGTVNIIFSPRKRTAFILQRNIIFLEADVIWVIRNHTYKVTPRNGQLESKLFTTGLAEFDTFPRV